MNKMPASILLGGSFEKRPTATPVEFTRCRGHLLSWEKELNDATDELALPAGVAAADGRAGERQGVRPRS